jgi:ferredoxin
MKAIVDTNLCIGCELCADTCPEIFAVLDDGFAHSLVDEVPPEEYDCVREAAEICPVEAITVVAT